MPKKPLDLLKQVKTQRGTEADRPELFFGLVGPIGTDLDTVAELLAEVLQNSVSYRSETIRLIDLLKELKGFDVPAAPPDERYEKGMNAGNEFRARLGQGDALVILGMRYVRERCRSGSVGATDEPVPRQAYIFRSLKQPAEVELLRRTYGGGFFLIGAYSPKELRIDYLARKIAGAEITTPEPEDRHKAEQLIDRDENEAGVAYGQAVGDTFPLSDIFIDVSKPRNEIRAALERFIQLVFGYPFHTPTRDEHGMFHAFAAALRSAAMGRQVGASLATDEGELIALGCNEVPKAFGGQYWGDENEDRRDFQLGVDSNDEIKRQNLAEVLVKLQKAGWLREPYSRQGNDQLVQAAEPVLKGTRLLSPLEYGRAVHAEMSAFMDAARRGVPVINATLYTTTYPCHECARHIVAAGVNEVVYIEPYPKSLATDLHKDSISVEEQGRKDKVLFRPFVGVAPRQYTGLFAMTPRKTDQGKTVGWNGRMAKPRTAGPYESYFKREDWLGASLLNKMQQVGINLVTKESN